MKFADSTYMPDRVQAATVSRQWRTHMPMAITYLKAQIRYRSHYVPLPTPPPLLSKPFLLTAPPAVPPLHHGKYRKKNKPENSSRKGGVGVSGASAATFPYFRTVKTQ